MPFFERQPPEEDAGSKTREWAPPVWDRPNEGVLGALVPMQRVVGRSDRVALVFDYLRAHPTGFVLGFSMIPNPRREARMHLFFRQGYFPRFGVEFADGRRAGDEANTSQPFSLRPLGEVGKDEAGLPTSPFIRVVGGGGGTHSYTTEVWVHPLPPPGPCKVYVEWSGVGIPETEIALDAEAIREAADRAVAVWE